ncbi:MAG: DUF3987 domain-containing protein [Pseudomonadota bacterium]
MSNVIPLPKTLALATTSPVQNMPTLIKDYVRLFASHSEVPAQLLAWTFIILFGASLGRNVSVQYPHHVFANLYLMVLGPTGAMKKDTAISYAMKFFPPIQLIRSIPTAEGLMRQLQNAPHLLAYVAEAGSFLRRMKQRTGATLSPLLCELFDAKDTAEHLVRGNPIIVEKPCFSLLTATTFERLHEELHVEHLDSGFANRFIYVTSSERKCIPFPTTPDPKEVIRHQDKVRVVVEHWQNNPSVFELHPDARRIWSAFYTALWTKQQAKTPEHSQIVQRLPLHAMKLALIFAALDMSPVITVDHVLCAMRIIEGLEPTYHQIVERLATSVDLKIEKRITEILTNGAALTKSEVRRKVGGHYSSVDFMRVLRAMESSNSICFTNGKYHL